MQRSAPKKTKKQKSAKKVPAAQSLAAAINDFSGFINRDYVPVNITELNATIDGMIQRFEETLMELQDIRKQIG